jgi:hypothetical protein
LCRTSDEIAEQIGWERSTVTKEINENVITGKVAKIHIFNFQDDTFSPPFYNVWKLQTKAKNWFQSRGILVIDQYQYQWLMVIFKPGTVRYRVAVLNRAATKAVFLCLIVGKCCG